MKGITRSPLLARMVASFNSNACSIAGRSYSKSYGENDERERERIGAREREEGLSGGGCALTFGE